MKLQHQLILGYSAVMIVLMAMSGMSYNKLKLLNESNHWVTHTHKVIGEINHVQKLILDMESDERGFLVSGEDKYLEHYNTALSEYKIDLHQLKEDVKNYPGQVQKLEIIINLMEEWIEKAAKPEIAMRRAVSIHSIDADHLEELLIKGDGQAILDEMRGIMDEMIARFKVDGNVTGQAYTEQVAKAMIDQVTGERGFIISGKEEFLEPFTRGHKEMTDALKHLRSLIANAHDRIGVEAKLDNLQTLTMKWHKEVGEVEIKMRREVTEGTRSIKDLEKIVTDGIGKDTFISIRKDLEFIDSQFQKAHNQKGHTYIVQIAKAIVDQETGQRGFIITGKEEFLEPYNQGQKDLKKSLDELRRLNKNAYDKIWMSASISKLEKLSKEWNKKAANPKIAARRLMDKHPTTLKDVNALLKKDTGKNIMDNLRKNILQFRDMEEKLLVEREEESEEAVATAFTIIISGILIAVIVALFASLYNIKSVTVQVGHDPGAIAAITTR
ncbi:MAG: CHASE3 domain-containing protein, partial [Lentisphaeria bacterium]|nr:CHASE3 domain-containing protein [Lentisphaeria bacterium]